MPTPYRTQHLSIMRRNEQRLGALFAQLAAQAAAIVARYASADGTIPRSASVAIQREIDELVVRVFLGRDRAGNLSPLDVLPNGTVIPLSPYSRTLWESIGAAVRVQVEQAAAIMRRRLPADVLQSLQARPFQSVQTGGPFRPNPLAAYDPPHTWVDPNGYRLSDRIWNTSQATRRRIDMLLDEAIREGRGATRLARDLEQFLQPGRQLVRTNRPYGRNGSYDALRLARTEIARAAAGAAEQSARRNPLVRGMKWNLSPQHRCCDVCDDRAQGGPNGDGVYPLDELPALPAHPHCMCYWTQALASRAEVADMLAQARADIQRTRADLEASIGPLQTQAFTDLLVGRTPTRMAA